MELIEVILSKENLNRAYKKVVALTYPKIRTYHPSGYKQYSLVTFLLFLSIRFLAHVLF